LSWSWKKRSQKPSRINWQRNSKGIWPPEFVSVDPQGIENVDSQLADMEKYDVRENTFADMKVTFPSPKVAVLTYKVSTQATHAGQDTSGTYNVASVWMKRGGNWLLICHTFMKSQ
jgi:Domain of unknown function (DUF4440)